ncbi:MAG: UDP-N-acetylmuramate--L-alanine ligase [Gemmatimonadota bacterium]|nr:UDP-N-acetylmuramate--L-alanine ligase [Gemmatimonadota bacterium]
MSSPAESKSGIYRLRQEWPRVKRFHLVGIGGIGMSGLAEILIRLGYDVSGSDICESQLTNRLAEMGGTIYRGHDKHHVADTDVLVYSAAIHNDNPEVVEARSKGILVLSRGDLLAAMVRQGTGIAVAGTHGKSTTTGMIGVMFLDCDLDPTLIVGAVVPTIGSNVRIGEGVHVIVEADEYNRSFLQLSPDIAVLTSIDADHLEYYGSQDAIDTAFLSFVHALPSHRPVIACNDDPGVCRLLPDVRRETITYGIESAADVRATEIILDGYTSSSTIIIGGIEAGRLILKRPGIYHISNALAAIATGNHLGLSWEEMRKSLTEFEGLKRRFEVKGEKNGITVIDDYAHHPVEVSALLRGATAGDSRIVAVFQPHLYSRTKLFAEDFGAALALADVVVLTDVFPSREKPVPGVTGELIHQAVRDQGNSDVFYVGDKHQLADFVSDKLQPGDTVLTIGAGDITDVGNQILERI